MPSADARRASLLDRLKHEARRSLEAERKVETFLWRIRAPLSFSRLDLKRALEMASMNRHGDNGGTVPEFDKIAVIVASPLFQYWQPENIRLHGCGLHRGRP